MGKRHREKRKAEKSIAKVMALRFQGETELGELRRKLTKAEARRNLIRRWVASTTRLWATNLDIERHLIDEVSRRATADIQAEEDALFFEVMKEYAPRSIWQHLTEE